MGHLVIAIRDNAALTATGQAPRPATAIELMLVGCSHPGEDPRGGSEFEIRT